MTHQQILATIPWLVAGCCWILNAASEVHAQRPQRYSGMLASGQRILGERLTDWHNKGSMPRLDNQPLLEPSNSLKWLRDRSLPLSSAPPAYVETRAGDVFPGTVVDARSGQELPFDPLPPHLLIEPAIDLSPPEKPASTTIRVTTAAIRRIVWQRRLQQPFQPSTLFFRDGRSLSYRALRFGSGFVNVLLESGSQKVSWSDLAEIDLPEVEFWPAYFDELAGACSSASSRLMQLETASGLVATASLERFAPRFEGNPQESERWVHGIQPAWSLDILWVRCREVVMRRMFLAHQVPLSRMNPSRIVAESILAGSGRPPQVNRSVHGGPVQSAQLDFGWGFGVQARSELWFDLPPGVTSFRSGAAIDRSSGSGGCAKARIQAGESNLTPRWESSHLVGSQMIADSGAIALDRPDSAKSSLVLSVDPAHEGRPPGADPLDIRDAVNWLDPLLELDPSYVQKELDHRIGERVFAWHDADVRQETTTPNSGLEVNYARNERLPAPGHFDTFVGSSSGSLAISRSFSLKPEDRWLVISAVRRPDGPNPAKLGIQIGGEDVAEYDPPPAQPDPGEVRPLAISLAPYQRPGGGTIRVTVRQPPSDRAAPLAWRSFQVAPQLPTLYCVFEDDKDSLSLPEALVNDQRHFGRTSIRAGLGATVDVRLAQSVAIRERPRWGEYRFVRFAVRKQGKGRIAVEFATEDARTEPARYDAGKGDPVSGRALRVWNDELPEQWIVLTRDLYGDIGSSNITSLALSCPDGEAAWFDHIYLARSPDDFHLIPAAPSADLTNEKARRELAQQAVERVRQSVVAVQLPGGAIGGGILIGNAGEVLTCGHFLRSAGQNVTVRLPDGKSAVARSLGISRELDLGLVKVETEEKWTGAPISDRQEVNPHASYAALVFPAGDKLDSPPELHVSSLRRFFRTVLWVDTDSTALVPGGVLVDPQGQVVGMHVRRSQFGGLLFTRLHAGELAIHLERMRRSEIFGAWPAGSEPLLGLDGTATRDGLSVTSVAENGPAAKSGIRVGDLVVRIHGTPVVSNESVSGALREVDGGQQVAIELVRDGAVSKAAITVAPRTP